MGLHRTSRQHPEIGSVALRMLWIPVVASIAVIGFLALRAPQGEFAPTMAAATAKELATQDRNVSPGDSPTLSDVAQPASPDESIAREQALDPVGAGHDVAR